MQFSTMIGITRFDWIRLVVGFLLVLEFAILPRATAMGKDIPECAQGTYVSGELHLLKELGQQCPANSQSTRNLIKTAIRDAHEKHKECNEFIRCYRKGGCLFLIFGPRYRGKIGSFVAYVVKHGKMEARFRIKLSFERKKYLDLYDPPRTFLTLQDAESMYTILDLVDQCITTSAELGALQVTGHQYSAVLVKRLAKGRLALVLVPGNHTWYNLDKYLVFIYDQQKQRFTSCFDFSASDNRPLLNKTLLKKELPEITPKEEESYKSRSIDVLTSEQQLLAESGRVYACLKWGEPLNFMSCVQINDTGVQEYSYTSPIRHHHYVWFITDPSGHKLVGYQVKQGRYASSRYVTFKNGKVVLKAPLMYVPEIQCDGKHESWETRYHAKELQFMKKNARVNKWRLDN